MKRSEFFPVPSVHEEWVRNRIARGAHYDPADDGPEIEIIARITEVQLEDVLIQLLKKLTKKTWLHPHTWPAEGPVDTLDHRRE